LQWLACVLASLPMLVCADVYHSVHFKLAHAERLQVEEVACLEPHGVKLDVSVGYWLKDRLWAIARCKPHGHVGKQLLHYEVTCVRDGTWSCMLPVGYLRAKVGKRAIRL